MIKVTFEGKTYHDIAVSMTEYLYESRGLETEAKPAAAKLEELKPKPEPKPDTTAERMAKVRAAKARKKAPEPTDLGVFPKGARGVVPGPQQPPPSDPRSSDEAWEEDKQAKLEGPDPFDEPETIDPVNLAALRLKTTEDLQAAYSGGKHKQVMALLSKYGNGARSFRELQIQDFIPIRKAIDEGALA
jgi:hypothetical protein